MPGQQLLDVMCERPTPTRRDVEPRQDNVVLALLAIQPLNRAKHPLESICCGTPKLNLGCLMLLISLCPLMIKLACQPSNLP